MNGIITYGSCYGTTKRYALALAERLGWQARSFETAASLDSYDTVIHLGGLYAGTVLGLKAVAKRLAPKTTLFVLTVGLVSGQTPQEQAQLQGMVRRQVPKPYYDERRVFHLRGGYDYEALTAKHKAMMRMMYQVLKLRGKKRTPQQEELLSTRSHAVDFTDLDALDPVVSAVRALES